MSGGDFSKMAKKQVHKDEITQTGIEQLKYEVAQEFGITHRTEKEKNKKQNRNVILEKRSKKNILFESIKNFYSAHNNTVIKKGGDHK